MENLKISRIKRNRNIMTQEEADMETKQIQDIVRVYGRELQEVAVRVNSTVDNHINGETEWIKDESLNVEFPTQLSDQEALSLLNGDPTFIQVKDGRYLYIPSPLNISGGTQ